MKISIHALREESDDEECNCDGAQRISIHALREESDSVAYLIPTLNKIISIHALREESDASITCVHLPFALFQSTLSVRRATIKSQLGFILSWISIHALREESDCKHS